MSHPTGLGMFYFLFFYKYFAPTELHFDATRLSQFSPFAPVKRIRLGFFVPWFTPEARVGIGRLKRIFSPKNCDFYN